MTSCDIRTIFVHQCSAEVSVWLICRTQTIFDEQGPGEHVPHPGLLHRRVGVSAALVVVFTLKRVILDHTDFFIQPASDD